MSWAVYRLHSLADRCLRPHPSSRDFSGSDGPRKCFNYTSAHLVIGCNYRMTSCKTISAPAPLRPYGSDIDGACNAQYTSTADRSGARQAGALHLARTRLPLRRPCDGGARPARPPPRFRSCRKRSESSSWLFGPVERRSRLARIFGSISSGMTSVQTFRKASARASSAPICFRRPRHYRQTCWSWAHSREAGSVRPLMAPSLGM